MTSSITWADLLDIYRNAKWVNDEEADVAIICNEMASTFQLVEESDQAQRDANLAALDPRSIAVGQTIRARIGPPRLSLGVLSDDWEMFLSSPEARIKEPDSYFIKEDGCYAGMASPPEKVIRYRAVIEFVGLMSKAALFVDQQRQTLVYFNEKKIEIPIRFAANDLQLLDPQSLVDLSTALDGDIHSEQRLAIFADAIVALAVSQPSGIRLLYLAQNAGELSRRVADGYRLFASSFSYAKIRGDVEAAQAEYVSRIHKTFVDIQGQLLGLPVATVVVATQLKSANACGIEAWANLAVIAGAWLFSALLVGSCVNQWFTLNAIKADIGRQKMKLNRDFSEIAGQFLDVFGGLGTRICWHRAAIAVIAFVAFAGSLFATVVFRSVTTVDFATCVR